MKTILRINYILQKFYSTILKVPPHKMLKIERIKSLLIIISLFASNCFCELPDANITSEKENGAANFTHETCQLETVSSKEFRTFYPVENWFNRNGVIELLVRFMGIADGHIALTANNTTDNPRSVSSYVISLGAYNNKVSEIRRGHILEHKTNTPGILSEHQYRGFLVRYNPRTGGIDVFPEGSDIPLLHLDDPNPLMIKYFAFSTWDNRVVQVAFNCKAKDAYSSLPLNDADDMSGQRKTSDTVSLRTNLMESYDPKVPPRSSDNGPIKILMGLTLTHFLLEETEQVFQANVWFSMSWTDNRLAWNRTSSDNDTTILRFASHEIWQPDIILINNALPTETFHYGEFLLIVKPDGLVLMTIPAKLTSHCGMNMIRWPFDEHTCNLKVGSWTHSGSEVDLDLPSNIASNPNHAIDSNLYVPNSEWNLIKTFAEKDNEYYACCEEPYAVVKYSFTIQRSSPSYAATIILPIIVITLVNIMVFILPPTAGEKLSLASINFFIVCIYLIYFEARLPSIGDHLPLLVLLYSINAVLIGISIVISVIVINLSRNHGRASSPPQCFRMFCNASFAQVLGLGYIVPYVSMTHSRLNDDEGVEMQPPRENGRPSFDHSDKDHTTPLVTEMPYSANAEWILLAAMIDRLTLIIYTIVSGVTLGLCLA